MSTQQLPSTASSSSEDNDIKFAYIKNKELEIWVSPDQKSTIVMPNISPNMMTQKELETYKIIESGRGFEKGVIEEPEQNVEEMSREKYDKALHANKELGKANFALRKEHETLRLFVETMKNQHDEDWRAKNELMDKRDKKQKKKIKKLEEENKKLKEQPKEADQDLPVAASSSTDSSARSTPHLPSHVATSSSQVISPTPISFSPEIEEYLQKHGGNIQFCKNFVALPCQEVRAVPMPSELFNAFKGKRTDICYDEEAQGVFHRFRATLKDEQNKQLATGQVTLKEKKKRTKRIASSGGIGEPSQKKPKFDRDESEDDQEELLDDM